MAWNDSWTGSSSSGDRDRDRDGGGSTSTIFPDYSGFTPGQSTMSQMLDAIRAANLNSQWEQAARRADIGSPWKTSDFNRDKRQQAFAGLNWFGFGSGGGGAGGGAGLPGGTVPNSTMFPPITPESSLGSALSQIGVQGWQGMPGPSYNPVTGATLSGPAPIITDSFRHLFNQPQVDAFALKQPSQIYKLGGDGNVQAANLNWWQPNALPGTFSNIKTIGDDKDGDKKSRDKEDDD